MSDPASMAHVALQYRNERGWSPFPVEPRGKRPLIPWTEYQHHLPDESCILAAFKRHPQANIGVACGAVSKVVVLDIDGAEGLQTLKERDFEIPRTLTVKTGRGFHFYFLHPGTSTRNFAKGPSGLLLPGVDFRGDGGFVVVPPSLHASGVRYEFQEDHSPAAIPEWLRLLVTEGHAVPSEPQEKGTATSSQTKKEHLPELILNRAITRAQPGSRNDMGFRLATRLRDNGLTMIEAEPLLRQYAAAVGSQGEEPYTDQEALASLRSAFTRSPRAPWKSRSTNGHAMHRPLEEDAIQILQRPPERTIAFPIEVLPPAIRPFVEEMAEALPCPVDLVAIPALVTAAAAIGNRRSIMLKKTWREPAALYAVIIQPPGTMKSPALSSATVPLKDKQRINIQQYNEEKAAYEEAMERYERAKKTKDGAQMAKPVKPICPRTWTTDVTVERLAVLLQENENGICLIRDELSAWTKSMNQYKGRGKGADRQFFLSAWSGAPYVVDRQGKDPISVERPLLSVVGCIPPAILPDLDDEGGEDGFIHRLLFAYPESVPARWTDDTVSDATLAAYKDLFENLYRLSEPSVDLTLTADARALFIEWHEDLCRQMESVPELRGFYAKLKGYGCRLMLIHALCCDPYATEVGVDSVAAGAELIEYFKTHAMRCTPLFRKTRTPHKRCEEEIRRHLAGGKILTKRELQRQGNSDAWIFNQVYEALLEAEQLMMTTKPGNKGDRSVVQLADEDQ